MLRDNLAGLIEPMVDRAGAPPLGGHPKPGPNGGCSRSTELAIVALQRSWRQICRWKTRRRAENGKWPGFEVTTAAHDSRAVGTAQHQSHRTIDPLCLRKSPSQRGGIFALTENVASPVHAEPRQVRQIRALRPLSRFLTHTQWNHHSLQRSSTPEAFNTTPLGINNEGEIVGYYSDPNGFYCLPGRAGGLPTY
jgi:hypothetical protein